MYEWERKVEYEKLEANIKEAEENKFGLEEEVDGMDMADFCNLHTKNHPTIIKVLFFLTTEFYTSNISSSFI